MDSGGDPVPGVTIRLKDTIYGVYSNNNGEYEIKGKVAGDAVLIFSFIGMETQEIPVEGQRIINVTMIEEEQGISEVVVNGVFTPKGQHLHRCCYFSKKR